MAADTLRAKPFQEAYLAVTKASPGSPDWLTLRMRAAKLGGAARQLVIAGNSKLVYRPGEMGFDTLFPEFAHFKTVSRSMTLEATREFAEGLNREAGDTLLASLVFAERIIGTGVLITHLVGSACGSIALAGFDENLERVSVPSWSKVIAFCDETLKSVPIKETMRREVAFSVTAFDHMLARPEEAFLFEEEEGDATDRDMVARIKALTPNQRLDLKKLFVERAENSLTKIEELYSQDESKWMTGAAMTENEARAGDSLVQWLMSSTQPVYSGVVQTELRRRCQIRLLRLHGLIQSHRWLTGALPARLEDLRRKDAIQDPLSGQPFNYRLQGDEYELYSPGAYPLTRIDLVYKRPKGESDEVAPP